MANPSFASQRNLPARGFRPATLLGIAGVFMLYGWYKVFHGIREQKYVLRPCLLLQAPSDANFVACCPSNQFRSRAQNFPDPHKLRFSEYGREKMWARIHLIPVLQAEEDRDQVRRHLADQAREKELIGENLKVYHSDR